MLASEGPPLGGGGVTWRTSHPREGSCMVKRRGDKRRSSRIHKARGKGRAAETPGKSFPTRGGGVRAQSKGAKCCAAEPGRLKGEGVCNAQGEKKTKKEKGCNRSGERKRKGKNHDPQCPMRQEGRAGDRRNRSIPIKGIARPR